MSKDLTAAQPLHINPYKKTVKEHEPAAGDYYATKSPHYNTRELYHLIEKVETQYGPRWKVETIFGPREEDTITEETLKKYYRPLLDDFGKIHMYAQMVVAGKSNEVAALLNEGRQQTPADTEELMATGSRQQVEALLDESEKMQNMLEEIRLTADIIIENKKAELEARLNEMEGFLKEMNKKVENLVKIITVLNLYTGKTVDLHVITEGEPADPYELLSLRQRILFMDEELCAELDHEADYQDVPLFFETLKDPAFRDIIVPEQRCIVAVKPKRRPMQYRSGDPYYDAARENWNRHTYFVLRNGENLWWLESDDLEVWDSTFPHSDFEETFQKKIQDPGTSFKDSLRKDHENVRYRTTKYMVFLQGLIDAKDILAPMKQHPNIMKHQGIELIRDDKNLIGTGRMKWEEFRNEKNKLIRRGTRILYDGGGVYRDGNTKWNSGGDFTKDYKYEYSKPQTPGWGVYHADNYECIQRYEYGEPVRGKANYLVFRYLPGDTVWTRGLYGYDETERKNRVAWKYEPRHVLNYDAVTTEELQGYLSDRTLREDFREVMPMLKKTLLEKRKEEADEKAFKDLVAAEERKRTGQECPAERIDQAVAWWKEKVIFTRPLRSDDAKAYKMILQYLKKHA